MYHVLYFKNSFLLAGGHCSHPWNMITAGGFISYIGPFTSEFRKSLTDKWLSFAKECDLTIDPSWRCADVHRDVKKPGIVINGMGEENYREPRP